jgi:hypothetical protein
MVFHDHGSYLFDLIGLGFRTVALQVHHFLDAIPSKQLKQG